MTRRFDVLVYLDGAQSVTVEITPTAGGSDAVVAVRPKRKRVRYTALLSWVARAVADHDAKLRAEARGISVPQPRRSRVK